MNKNKRGFSIIELMIAVAIIGILTAVALPAYQDYTVKSQVTEGLLLATGAKVAMVEYHANHGIFPRDNEQLGYAGGVGKYVSEVVVNSDGFIMATFGDFAHEKVRGKIVVLSATSVGESVEVASIGSFLSSLFISNAFAQSAESAERGWVCFSNVEKKYLPASCEHKDITKVVETNEPEVTPPTELPDIDKSKASAGNPVVTGQGPKLSTWNGSDYRIYGRYGNIVVKPDGSYTYTIIKELYDLAGDSERMPENWSYPYTDENGQIQQQKIYIEVE